MTSTISFIVIREDENPNIRLNEIKAQHEKLNPNCEVTIKILSETTEGCGIGSKIYNYELEIIDKYDLEEQELNK